MEPITVEVRDQPVALGTRERTPEGYLKANAAIMQVGVMAYASDELGIAGEPHKVDLYRGPESVFDDATLASFSGKPLTIGHPGEDVTSANYARLAVGHIVDQPKRIGRRAHGRQHPGDASRRHRGD